jgi:hypothetical protein
MLSSLLLLVAVQQDQLVIQKFPISHRSGSALYESLFPDGLRRAEIPTGIKELMVDYATNTIIAYGTQAAIDALRELLKELDAVEVMERLPLRRFDVSFMKELLTESGRFTDDRPKSTVSTLLPLGADIVVDVSTNSLLVSGAPGAIKKTRQLIDRIDVNAVPLRIDVQGSVIALGATFKNGGEVLNFSEWNGTHSETETTYSVHPRINPDGTGTVLVRGGALKTSAKFTAKVKAGETLAVRIFPGRRIVPVTNQYEPTILVEYVTGPVPLGFLEGAPLPSDTKVTKIDDGPVAIAPREAELRLVIRVTLPAQ